MQNHGADNTVSPFIKNVMTLKKMNELNFEAWLQRKISEKLITDLGEGWFLYKGIKKTKFSLQVDWKLEIRS